MKTAADNDNGEALRSSLYRPATSPLSRQKQDIRNGLHPETNNAIVPGGWSIGVEMGFYAILALLLTRIKSVRSNTGSVLHFLCLLLVSAGAAFFSYRLHREARNCVERVLD